MHVGSGGQRVDDPVAPELAVRREQRKMAKVASQAHASGDDLLYLETVVSRVGMGRSMIYALIGEGRFPKPIKRGPKWSRWRAGDIAGWQQKVLSGQGWPDAK